MQQILKVNFESNTSIFINSARNV